jgi:hypothetical protein
LVVRQQHARPLLDQLKEFLDTALGRVSGKSTLAQAIRYALSRWQALERYLTDGRLEMSNNAAERAMKSPVLGRKNYLFCGSDAGGQRAACIYTITETCKMNGIDPHAYLTNVLAKIADHPINKIDTLLPWHPALTLTPMKDDEKKPRQKFGKPPFVPTPAEQRLMVQILASNGTPSARLRRSLPGTSKGQGRSEGIERRRCARCSARSWTAAMPIRSRV